MTAAYSFGRFELNPGTRQLLVDGQPAALGTRAFDVLMALVERRERLVTKAELLELAWPGLVVEEANLQVQISGLRKILGDQHIRTVAGRGYQFTAEVTQRSSRRSAEPERHNLPRPLTRFIGHEADLEDYAGILTTNRLVTLTGIGGCGKTRLAIELARRVLPSFEHGAWFVDLAPMADAERLPLTVAKTLGVNERPGESIVETLCECVSEWQILLVLDNCEHLVNACAALVQTMLGAAKDLTVLATSREALGVTGEYTLRVRSLSFPPAGPDNRFDKCLPDQVQAFEAVQLFVDRARLVQPGFAVDSETARAVSEICRRLDGIPLAIELAAARMKVCSAAELRNMLDDRFRLLVGGSRTAPLRQQTLLAAIKWSFDFLPPEERALLEGLSVFAGGWTLESAVAVAGEKAGQYDVLEHLTRLVDKSLIKASVDDGTTRYSMLETVREYARDRLLERGDESVWRDRHLANFLELAEQAEPHLTGPEQQVWLDQLESEHENLRMAFTWSVNAAGRIASGLRLATALVRFWRVRGYLGEGRAALSATLAVAPETQGRAIRAKALCGAGTLAADQGDSGALRAFEEGLALCRELDDQLGIANALHGLARLAHDQRDLARTRALQEEVVAIRRKLNDRQGLCKALTNLGNTISGLGDVPSALTHLEESLAISRDLGNREEMAWTLVNLALIAGDDAGNLSGGLPRIRESLSIFRGLGDRRGVAATLQVVASAELDMGHPEKAVRLWAAAEQLVKEIGFVQPRDEDLRRDRGLEAARVALGDAAYNQARREGRSMTWEEAAQYALRHDV